MNIGVIGLWHLGEVVSSCLAELGHKVIAYDLDPAVIEKLRRGEPVLPEPGIPELITKNKKRGWLSYKVFLPQEMKSHDAVFVTFDTPIKKDDSPDVKIIEDTVTAIAKHAKSDSLIVVMSQLPVGGTASLREKVKKARGKSNIAIAYVPENLQLGKAVESFMKPSRTIIGAYTGETAEKVKKIFKGLPGEFIAMSPASAEMVKHALNSFLAVSLSFIYNISDLCEEVGADAVAVSRALKSDSRIGQAAYLDTSLGFSGGTLMRDMRVLELRAKKAKLKIPVISGAITTNAARFSRALALLKTHLGSLENKTVTIAGLTYKPGTPTLRSSLAVSLVKLLKRNGLRISGSDPAADLGEAERATGGRVYRDIYEAASGSQAVVMITAWPEYASLDFKKLKRAMRPPFLFVDARNFLASRAREFESLGFRYLGVGRGSIDV